MALHASDMVVVSDRMVSEALGVDIDTLFIIVRGPYEAEASNKYSKSLKICVDAMANGKIYEKIPCGWFLRVKDKDKQHR